MKVKRDVERDCGLRIQGLSFRQRSHAILLWDKGLQYHNLLTGFVIPLHYRECAKG